MRLSPTLLALCPIALMWGADIAGTDLPQDWAATDIGPVKAAGMATYDLAAKSFTVKSSAEVTESGMTFAYKKVKGDFVATCRVTEQSKSAIATGLMMRVDTAKGTRFLRNGYQGEGFGNGPCATFAASDEGPSANPGDITYVQALPCWVRIARIGNGVASYYSADGKEWNLMHFGGVGFQPGLPDEVLVGITNCQHDSHDPLESATIDNVTIEQNVKMPYATSWLGNSFASNYYQGHIQMQITGMTIDRSGKKPILRVTGQNEALDSSAFDLDGNLLWMYQTENGGTPHIAADGGFIYESTGGNDNGMSRLKRFDATNTHAAPDTSGRVFNSIKENDSALSLAGQQIAGLDAKNGVVYVSEANSERVVILDGKSMTEKTSFASPRAGSLALDGKGGMWVVQREGTDISNPYKAKDGEIPEVHGSNIAYRPDGKPHDPAHAAKIHYYTIDGKPDTARTITFDKLPAPVLPVSISLNPVTGNLYVCDVGPNQCVWIFDAKGAQVGRVGEVGGVYKNKVPGTVDATHLYFPRKIVIDDAGCMYVAMCPREGWVGGALLRKYDPTGTKVMWERQGLEFQEAADGDPGTDYTDVFTQTHHYTMDFSKKQGKEASFQALTYDPFSYPADIRNAMHGGAVNATVVRRIAGKRILYLHHWPRHGEQLYRFAEGSEIAIPAGSVTNDGIWVDANGNGIRDAGETGPKLGEKTRGDSWVVDANGDIWNAGNSGVRCWRNQGLNAAGAPVFTQEPTETYGVPVGLKYPSHAIYDAALDRLFIGGYTEARPKDQEDHGGGIGSVLVGIADARKTKGVTKVMWTRDIPYIAGTKGGGNETNNMFCGSYAGDEKGGYLFIGGLSERGVKKTSVWALDPTTGTQVETFLPGAEVGGYCGWFDFNNAINAMKRKNGEYIIYAEDDGAQKVNFFRWTPSK